MGILKFYDYLLAFSNTIDEKHSTTYQQIMHRFTIPFTIECQWRNILMNKMDLSNHSRIIHDRRTHSLVRGKCLKDSRFKRLLA